jgi:hypothetical protein
MWRVLALSVLLAACGDGGGTQAAIDAAPVLRTAMFIPLLCTGGSPGDATCPITIVDLSGIGIVARFQFVTQPLSQDLYLTDMQLDGAAHIDGLYVEWWDASTSSNPAGSVLLAASLDGGGMLASQVLQGAATPTKLSLRFDAVRPL